MFYRIWCIISARFLRSRSTITNEQASQFFRLYFGRSSSSSASKYDVTESPEHSEFAFPVEITFVLRNPYEIILVPDLSVEEFCATSISEGLRSKPHEPATWEEPYDRHENVLKQARSARTDPHCRSVFRHKHQQTYTWKFHKHQSAARHCCRPYYWYEWGSWSTDGAATTASGFSRTSENTKFPRYIEI